MSLRAVRLSTGLGAEGPVRVTLDADPGRALAAARDEPGPVVFLLPDDALAALDRCRDLILDRGRKHPTKPLAPMLLGQPRIPLVRGGHTSSGQLLRSVRALLTRAWERGDGNLFLVAVSPRAFEEVWARSRTVEGGEAAAPPPAGPDRTVPPSSAARPAGSLLALLPELPVPDTVRERFVGRSPEVAAVHQLLLRAARREDPVLLLGDTGTGKEVVARLIHDQSDRRFQTFTPVNCGAIPRELLESELFGYEKGAHSTATQRKLGLWRTADGGTLFLDEIADLSLDHQVRILRALEYGEIRPVGAERAVQVDARVIAATNRDLFGAVRAGTFREDLYYRLRSFMIRTPALRDHPGDIPQLADHFWRKITRDPGASLPAPVAEELAAWRWPGNARELKMVLTSLFALFGAFHPTPAQLRAVFEFEGQAGAEPPPASSELGLHRVECLRQLRRADEVLRAAQVDLQRAAEGGDGRASEAVTRRAAELAELCRRPLLFHGEETFARVRRVEERLGRLAAALRAGTPPPDDAGEALDQALSAVFREVDRLLSSVSPPA